MSDIQKGLNSPKARMACVVGLIKTQCENTTPETKLLFAIFQQTAKDVFDKTEHASAKRFFEGNMECLQMCGINPDWVRLMFRKEDLWRFVIAYYDV